MDKVDRVLKVICQCFVVVFLVVASFFSFAFLLGLLLLMHMEFAAGIWEQCKNLGRLAIVCIIAAFAFDAVVGSIKRR